MQRGVDYIGIGVGIMILSDNGEVFLIKRGENASNERGCWENPGGAVEVGETFEEAAHREILEELGVRIEVTGKLPIQECFLKNDRQHWVTQTFVAKLVVNQKPRLVEKGKHTDTGWFHPSKLPAPMSQISQEDIAQYTALYANV